MKNPFPISDEKLKILLDRFSSWVDSNEKEKSYAPKEREKSKEPEKKGKAAKKKEEVRPFYLLVENEMFEILRSCIATMSPAFWNGRSKR